LATYFTVFQIVINIYNELLEKNTIDKPENDDPVPILPDGKSAAVIESMNDFGFDLFRLVLADEPADTNVFISPASISLALAMTLNGANSSTEDSMAFALRMNHLTAASINETYRDLITALTSCDEKVLLEIANSIWYRQGFDVEQVFLDINTEYYNAEVAGLNFNDPSAAETMNGWVADKTHDKITQIITPPIDPLTVMFLINAIYFKGVWTIEFDEDKTLEAPFILAGGDDKTVNMMTLVETIGYYENEQFQACQLDYGRGNYCMNIFLPKEGVTVEDIAENMNPENWEAWTSSSDTATVVISLPRFKFEYEKKLNDILSLMGMGIAFSDWADFTGINTNGGLSISQVKHKTFVEVNEEGTEAAAVTVVEIGFTCVRPDYKKYMIMNKPFLFTIREKTSNTIVFMGKLANPKD